ncbi:MAG: glycosyltransferase family 4 protein [Acidimicrobiales bacterium]
MRPSRIDQVLHILAYNDAIGNHVLALRDVLRTAGFESDIYAGQVHPELKNESRDVEDLPLNPRAGSWILFHHSIGSTVAETVLKRPEPLVVDYHNITPSRLVDRWAPWVREELDLGIEQLEQLAPKAFFGIAHSAFSERELQQAGCHQTAVAPPLFSIPSSGADPAALASLRSAKSAGGSDWLFVGRISPHKAQHDLIKAIACTRGVYDPQARLHLVGTSLGTDYPRALERFCSRLKVGDAVRMTGAVPGSVLAAYYETADVFVCTSEHEGFCVPVVEAMAKGVPVVAYDAAAVGETVGGGGLLLEDKSPMVVAAAVQRVVSDPVLSLRLTDAGRSRAAELSLPASAKTFLSAIGRAVNVAAELGVT